MSETIEQTSPATIKVPEFPDVTFKEFENPSELDALDQLHHKNGEFFGKSGIHVNGFRKDIEEKLAGKAHDRDRFYGGWMNGKLIGVANISQYSPGEVEIAGAVDKDFVRKGLALASAKALIRHELDAGNDIVAEIEPRNEGVVRPLLEKLDFDFEKESRTNGGRVVYSTPPTNEASLMRRMGF